MKKRWVAAEMAEAQRSFRRIRGYKQMPLLIAALRRHEHPPLGRGHVSANASWRAAHSPSSTPLQHQTRGSFAVRAGVPYSGNGVRSCRELHLYPNAIGRSTDDTSS